jgi:hypothetical protein
VRVAIHNVPGPDRAHAHPYGVHDLKRNEGFVNIGQEYDTAQFAAASIRAWWLNVGEGSIPPDVAHTDNGDSGGSKGIRRRQWKYELQRLADDTGLTIGVCPYPPGTSKWNKVEYRLFAFISQQWRGEPLERYETIEN